MSDKQLTGTITLPGVDPELYELTGEYRQAKRGECYCDWMGVPRINESSNRTHSMFPILRKKPRKIRVTPTQADLDAAGEKGHEGIECWVRDSSWNPGHWEIRYLVAISPLKRKYRYCCAHTVGIYEFCEIEKEVTE